jgi:hypothetical protein
MLRINRCPLGTKFVLYDLVTASQAEMWEEFLQRQEGLATQ